MRKLQLLVNRSHLNFITGYQFYYVLGYWLKRNVKIIKKKIYLIFLYCSNVFLCIYLTFFISLKQDNGIDTRFFDYFFITTFFEAISLFLIFYDLKLIGRIKEKIIFIISNLTFGIYILHVIFIKNYSGYYIIDWNKYNYINLITESLIIFIICSVLQFSIDLVIKNRFKEV